MKKRMIALILTLVLALNLVVGASAASYTVQPGDSLSSIAGEFLGDIAKWEDIFDVNKAQISDPNVIYAGQELNIPEAPATEEEAPSLIPEVTDPDPSLWDEKTAANMGMFFSAMEEAKYIVNRPHAYEKDSFNAYFDAFEMNYWLALSSKVVLTDADMWSVYALLDAREKLVQVVDDPEDTIWYIWGEDMPAEADAADYDYTYAYDRSDFKPFLVPYLLEDQSAVKGNIIVIAGGGYSLRSSSYEGYAVAERFNELGYNTFVLQRRVAPSTPTDAHLDLQRAIRYIRYHADELGIVKTDKMAACGFSGGAMTICGAINDCYGSVLPTEFYPDYQCDEVDQVNSDLQAALLIYGADALDTENPNIPPMFMAIGTKDNYGLHKNQLAAVEYCMENDICFEAHFFADMPHGFGAEWGFNSTSFENYESPVSSVWPEMADTFLSVQWGYVEQFTPHER